MQRNKFIFFIIFWIGLTTSSIGQLRISSPYSRFGIGDIQNSISAMNIGMGGISSAYRSPFTVNYSNPASYTSISNNSFVFDGGLVSSFDHLSTTDVSQNANYTNLNNLLFGFPITKWWKSSFGLVPVSRVGYNVTVQDSDATLQNYVVHKYEGSGGINKVYWGHAFKIKDFSVGFNASYMFGSLQDNQTISFPSGYNDYRQQHTVNIHDFYFDYGLQYEHSFYDSSFVALSPNDTSVSAGKRFRNSVKKFKNGFSIGFGLTFNNSTKLSTTENIIVGHPDLSNNLTDSLIQQTNTAAIMLPRSIGGGLILRKENVFLIGMDYKWTKWSEFYNHSNYFSSADSATSLVNNWSAGIGLELYYKKRYPVRVGYHYSSSYLKINGQPVNSEIITLGVGLPFTNKISKSVTMVNIAFEFGHVGTTNMNLIRDNYVRATLGISILEKWFTKSKYF